MRDLDKALADIVTIRTQLAAGTAFRGFGPAAVATTGGLALLTAIVQALWLENPNDQPLIFFAGWLITALLSAGLIGAEIRARSSRHHSGLADAMLLNAIEQFLPAAAAGALLGMVFLRFAPESVWMLPGLWQILVGVGIFASVRTLPHTVAVAGAWYFVAGLGVLMLTSDGHVLSPWVMGLPFAIGQILMAVILYSASGDTDAED